MNLFRWFFFITTVISNVIAQTSVEKKSAIVVDYTNGNKVLYKERADEKRYPASLTKMMTLYLLFDAIKSGKVKLSTQFHVSKFAMGQAPSKLDLKVGSKISASDAIKALLVKSANDVAVVVAEGLAGNVEKFCKLMNQKCIKLKMKNTHFVNPSGLPNQKQTSTASDMIKLGIALYRDFPQYRPLLSLKQFSYGKKKYKTHCKILHWYKGADAAKTGYICASGFNLMVSANRYSKNGKARRLFVVVMGGDTAKKRDIYAGQLMDKYFDEFSLVKKKSLTRNLLAQVSKTEMLDDVVKADEEMVIKNQQVISDFNKMLDDLYNDNDECLPAEDEIVIKPHKMSSENKLTQNMSPEKVSIQTKIFKQKTSQKVSSKNEKMKKRKN